jgi:putative PIN family toxin of toxin-antitoxin system
VLTVVVDTNIWVRALLGGRVSLPILEAWLQKKFQTVCCEELLQELDEVCKRRRLRERIAEPDARTLLKQLRQRSIMVQLVTTPPSCRDPKDNPVLAAAIDGHADAIVTGDNDMRADEDLRREMAAYGVQLWGIETLLERI